VQIDVCGEIKLVFVELELVECSEVEASCHGARARAGTPTRGLFFVFLDPF
jgi:hypothetical protein